VKFSASWGGDFSLFPAFRPETASLKQKIQLRLEAAFSKAAIPARCSDGGCPPLTYPAAAAAVADAR
jgi:hypothetical protein